MSETHDLRPVARTVADLVASIGDEQLAAPTPCPEYTVGDLLDHVAGLSVAFTVAATKESLPGGRAAHPAMRRGSTTTGARRSRRG